MSIHHILTFFVWKYFDKKNFDVNENLMKLNNFHLKFIHSFPKWGKMKKRNIGQW